MKSTDKGYVYILTNPSFREDWVKIGKSSRPVDVRSKELDNTAVPLPFEIFATLATKKYHEVEKLVHKTIDRLTDLRIRQNREFFNVEPQMALEIFKDIALAIDDAIITEYKNNKPTTAENITSEETTREEKAVDRRGWFKFSLIGVKIGEYVTFIPTNTRVKVISDDSVEHEGRIYKLSPFVGTFMPKALRNSSGAYQGSKYFSYKGNTLYDLRKKQEEAQSKRNNNAPESLSATLRLQEEFWVNFREAAMKDAEFMRVFSLQKAQPQHWYTLRIGSSTCQLHLLTDTRKKRIGCALYFSGDKDFYHKLYAEQETLIREIGATPEWAEANKDCRMAIFQNGDISDRTVWPHYFSWLRQQSLRLREIYKSRV